MTDINELAQRMKAAALKAIADEGPTWFSKDQLSHPEGIALHEDDVEFIALASHENVLALVEALEAKDNRINRLEAIVSVAEQRNALMREWKRALKVPCDLVDNQVPVVIHGMVIRLERLKETETKLEAAEKRIADYQELISGLVDISSSILREVDRINNAAAAGKGEAS